MASLTYTPPGPTVKRFLESDARRRCIIGPFGSGKSSGCAIEIARRMYAQAPDKKGVRRTRFAIVRNTKGQLRDTTRKTFDSWLGQFGAWRESPNTEFRIRTPTVDCEVLFRALDEPKDVRNLLSLELTGAYFNELREIAEEVWDGMDSRIGRFPAKKDGAGVTWAGMWADSNPWHDGHWADTKFTSNFPGYELFRQPSGLSKEAENVSGQSEGRGYWENMCAGKSSAWIDVYVHGLNAKADDASIFGQWLAEIKRSGRVGPFDHPTHDVFTNWDLGLADSTAIFFWRVTPEGVEVLDWVENSGKDLQWYFDELEGRSLPLGQWHERADGTRVFGLGWKYVKHWLPHDAAQKTLAAGTSVLNRFLARFGTDKVAIGPNLSKLDGIESGRWLLQQPGTRFHERCADAVKRLAEYKYAWDDKGMCFSRYPLHNFASHTGDCWRYVGNVAKVTGLIMTKPKNTTFVDMGGILVKDPRAPLPPPPKGYVSEGKINLSLNDLWKR